MVFLIEWHINFNAYYSKLRKNFQNFLLFASVSSVSINQHQLSLLESIFILIEKRKKWHFSDKNFKPLSDLFKKCRSFKELILIITFKFTSIWHLISKLFTNTFYYKLSKYMKIKKKNLRNILVIFIIKHFTNIKNISRKIQ